MFAEKFEEFHDNRLFVLSKHPLHAVMARGDVLTETRRQVADREGGVDNDSLNRLLVDLLSSRNRSFGANSRFFCLRVADHHQSRSKARSFVRTGRIKFKG